jgi:hypothetical protein
MNLITLLNSLSQKCTRLLAKRYKIYMPIMACTQQSHFRTLADRDSHQSLPFCAVSAHWQNRVARHYYQGLSSPSSDSTSTPNELFTSEAAPWSLKDV